MIQYIVFALPAYLIARPKEYFRSALAYCVGVAMAWGSFAIMMEAFHVPEAQLNAHVGELFLLPFVGVGIAWVTKTAVVKTPAHDVSSMRVRFGIFLGWLFNAVALVCAAPGAIFFIKQGGQVTDEQSIWITMSLGGACAVWLLGRGIRYVLVGPPHAASLSDLSAQNGYSLKTDGSHGTTSVPLVPTNQTPAKHWGASVRE
jgi:hypothetical protein